MYDIYVYRGCKLHHNFSDLYKLSSNINIEKVAQILVLDRPNFLGMNLSLDIARDILKFLIALEPRRIQGRLIPIRYRDEESKFTPKTAYPIAEAELKKRQLRYPEITFSEIVFGPAYSRLEYFTFLSVGREWVDSGVIPGALFIHIDKLDGHVWADDEGDELSL